VILFLILGGISLLVFTLFHQSYETIDNQVQPKIRIIISYANYTSNTYTILANSNQKYTISQQYSWAINNFTRFNLQAYSLDNNSFLPIQRTSNGNFTSYVSTDADHSIVFMTKPQFKIITSDISKMNFSPPSPTNDNWFDADSDIQVIVPNVIQSYQEESRQQLGGWSLDSPDIDIISRQESGTFKSPVIHMSSEHKIDLKYYTQYYIKVISNFGRALGSGWYDSGTIADVSVMPSDDILIKHVFTGWQGQVIGSQNQESVGVLVDSPKTIVANWFVDYTNVSIIGVFAIAVIVLSLIYLRRRTFSKA
jgi:hypothetical protein